MNSYTIITLLHTDGSGMDFRTMLKKKKYAKNVIAEDDPDWGNLKKVERPEAEPEPDDKPVRIPAFFRTFSSARRKRSPSASLFFVPSYFISVSVDLRKQLSFSWRLDTTYFLTQIDEIFPHYTEVQKKFGGRRYPGT